MSCVGVLMDLPDAGEKMALAESIRRRDSICASTESGTWTAIWSPSKSALNGVQVRGCRRMALSSTSTGSKLWMERRWRVGARLSMTVLPLVTSSSTSHTCGSRRSMSFLAERTVWARFFSFIRRMMNGSKSVRAISLGRPHCQSLSSGPQTMTERPE